MGESQGPQGRSQGEATPRAPVLAAEPRDRDNDIPHRSLEPIRPTVPLRPRDQARAHPYSFLNFNSFARAGSYALQARSCFAVLIVCAVVQGLEQKYLLWPLVPVFMSAPHSRQTELLVFTVKNQSHLTMVGGVFKRVSVA